MIIEARLLATLRNPAHMHLVMSLAPEWFRAFPDVAAAYREAYQRYGTISVDALSLLLPSGIPDEILIPINADPYPLIEELKREHKRYRTRALADALIDEAKKREPNPEDVIQHYPDLLTRAPVVQTSIKDGVDALKALITSKQEGTYRAITTGIPFIDAALGGEVPRAALSAITGKSGGGKTAVMCTMALNLAIRHRDEGLGSPVGIFSLEMTREQLITRMVAELSLIDSRVISSGRNLDGTPWTEDQRYRIETALETISTLPISIVDTEGLSANDICGIATQLHGEQGAQVFFIDYFQLLNYGKDTDIERGIHYGLSEQAKTLASFAKRTNTSVITLAQVNERHENAIRDSTDLERVVALWMHVTIDFAAKDSNGLCPATIDVRKSRFSPCVRKNVIWDAPHMRFVEVGGYE